MSDDSAGTAATSPVPRRLWDRYVRTAPSPPLAPIRARLWPGGKAVTWDSLDSATRAAVLDQYKVYVEGADRISARRRVANSFFLALNTAVVTLVGIVAEHPVRISAVMILAPWLALVVQCLAWFWILRSYRQLSSAKYAVIGAIEEALPSSPWWRAEWSALGSGTDPTRYWPFSHVEQLIPALFAGVYSLGFLLLAVR